MDILFYFLGILFFLDYFELLKRWETYIVLILGFFLLGLIRLTIIVLKKNIVEYFIPKKNDFYKNTVEEVTRLAEQKWPKKEA